MSSPNAPTARRSLEMVLFDGLPEHHKFHGSRQILDVPKVAEAIGVSKQLLYKWIKSDRLPPNRAERVAGLSGAKVTFLDLKEFMISDR